jgi:hypothetical protein
MKTAVKNIFFLLLLLFRLYFFKNVLFFFFFFVTVCFVCCVLQILIHIPSEERTYMLVKKKKGLKFYSLSLSSFVCIEKKTSREFRFFHLHIHLKSFGVCCTSSYINVKKEESKDVKPMAHLTIVTKR